MKKPIEIIYTDLRDFARQIGHLCCDMPIKYRQVFVPMMTGVMDRTIVNLASLRANPQKEIPLVEIRKNVSEWQVILEMILDIKAVKDTRIAPLLDMSANLRKNI